MRLSTVFGALTLGLALAAAPARAPKTESKPAAPAPAGDDAKSDAGKAAGDEKAEDKKPSLTGGYSWSDKPAKGTYRWKPKKKIDPNTPIATYPGFRMLANGGSQVWVTVTRKVPVTAATTSGMPTFVLMGAYVSTRNNTNPLVTTWFETPLGRARLRNDAAGAQLTLELREQVSVTHRVVDGPGGTMTLYVELPKPSKSYVDEQELVLEPSVRRSKGGGVLPTKGTSGKGGSKRGPTP